MQLGAPPHDVGAEEVVLGAMMLDPAAIEPVLALLSVEDFYRPAHRTVFEAVLALNRAGEPSDAKAVGVRLTQQGAIADVGGAAFLHTLIESVPTASNAGWFAEQVRQFGDRRRLIDAGVRLAQLGREDGWERERHLTAAREIARTLPGLDGDGPAPLWRERLAVLHLDDVAVKPVRWLWPGRIPMGKITVLDGDPDMGKSTVTIDLAARVSTGSPMPTGERTMTRPGTVVMLSAEDGAEDTIKPRLLAAQGDPARVHLVDHTSAEDGARPFEIPADLDYLHGLITEVGAVLVVVDPLMAFLGAGVKANLDQDVRRAMHPLKELAEATGAAFLVVRHLNKAEGGNPLYRGGGSIGIVGAARAGLLVGRDKEDETLRVLASTKHNLAREEDAASVGYRLVPDELHDVARVQWGEIMAVTAGELLVGEDPETPERKEAMDFLCAELAKGPAQWAALAKLAKVQDITEATLRRARSILQSRGTIGKRTNGTVGEAGFFWEWFLTERGA